MKKVMTFVMAIVMMLALVLCSACSSSDAGTHQRSETESVPATSTWETIKIDDLIEEADAARESKYAAKYGATETTVSESTASGKRKTLEELDKEYEQEKLAEQQSSAASTSKTPVATKKQTTTAKPTEAADPDAEALYILNTNTKKFHRPGCASVKDMSEKNKQESSASRQEIIDSGYTPCGRCKP